MSSAVDKQVRQRRRYRMAGAALAAAVAAGVAVGTMTGAGAAEAPSGTEAEAQALGYRLPPGSPQPGPDFKIAFAYRVTSGTQTYTCGDAGTWNAASVPEANLASYGRRLGDIHHFGGPSWQAKDGSLVRAAKTAEKPAAGTIPWLLLTVNAHEGTGQLDPITHISRVRTSGGTAPAGTCAPGETAAVPYGADYVFWAARQQVS